MQKVGLSSMIFLSITLASAVLAFLGRSYYLQTDVLVCYLPSLVLIGSFVLHSTSSKAEVAS